MKKVLSFILLLITIVLATTINLFAEAEWKVLQFKPFFGDGVSIDIRIDTTEEKKNTYSTEIGNIIQTYHNITSNMGDSTIPGGIYDINQKPGQRIEITKELYELLELSLHYNEITDGYFDVTIGTVIDVWKGAIKSNNFKEISSAAFNYLMSSVQNVVDLLPEQEDRLKIFENAGIYQVEIGVGVKLDLGAIAKGYVTELIKEYLVSKGETRYSINAGGSSIFYGENLDGQGFNLNFRDPTVYDPFGFINANYGSVNNIKDIGLASSGNEVQYFLYKGVRYHHIISPKTYMPSSDYYVLTLFGADAGMLDAFSTAAFSMPKDKITTLLEDNGVKAIFYQKDGNLWNLLDSSFNFEENLDRKYPDPYEGEPASDYGKWIIIGIICFVTVAVISVFSVFIYKTIRKMKLDEATIDEKQSKKLTIRRDVLMLVIIAVLAAAIFAVYMLVPKRQAGIVRVYFEKEAIVEINFAKQEVIDLKSNPNIEIQISGNSTITIFQIEDDNTIELMVISYNMVEIEVEVISSDCIGQDCVHVGKSSNTPIVCLPNRIIIQFEGE